MIRTRTTRRKRRLHLLTIDIDRFDQGEGDDVLFSMRMSARARCLSGADDSGCELCSDEDERGRIVGSASVYVARHSDEQEFYYRLDAESGDLEHVADLVLNHKAHNGDLCNKPSLWTRSADDPLTRAVGGDFFDYCRPIVIVDSHGASLVDAWIAARADEIFYSALTVVLLADHWPAKNMINVGFKVVDKNVCARHGSMAVPRKAANLLKRIRLSGLRLTGDVASERDLVADRNDALLRTASKPEGLQ